MADGPSIVGRVESELTRQGILLLIVTAMLILVSFLLCLLCSHLPVIYANRAKIQSTPNVYLLGIAVGLLGY